MERLRRWNGKDGNNGRRTNIEQKDKYTSKVQEWNKEKMEISYDEGITENGKPQRWLSNTKS